MTKLSKSQVRVMATELDEMVTQFRSRPLDAGPYTFVWIAAWPPAGCPGCSWSPPTATTDDARDDILAFTAFPREIWRQI